MTRLFVRTAVAASALLWAAGCSSTPSDVNADALTSKQAANYDDSQGLGTPGKNLAANLDGEIRRAQLMRTAGDFEGASKSLAQLMLIAPDDPRVVGEYGKALAQRGQSQDALSFLKRAIQLNPSDWTLYSALGVTYDQIDDRTNAKLAYEHALSLKPGDATVLNNYAVSRMLAGDLDGAQNLLAQAASQGTSYAKIANNTQMVADLRTQAGQPVSNLNVAKTDVKKPVAAATKAPAPVAMQTLPPPSNAIAQTEPKTVMMQQVPVDPLAGPVKTARAATKPPRKLASATAPAPQMKKQASEVAKKANDAGPKLRTASGDAD